MIHRRHRTHGSDWPECQERSIRGSVRLPQKLRIDVNRGVQPALFATNLNCGLVDRDPPRTRPRRVVTLLTNTVGSLIHRLT